jgi:hypothetical protein
MDENEVLENAISAYLNNLQAEAEKRKHYSPLEYELCYEITDDRRVSRKGNTVIAVCEEGEYVSGGPIEDPFTSPYGYVYEAVFSPSGELLQEIRL